MPSVLRCLEQIGTFPIQTPPDTPPVLRTQPLSRPSVTFRDKVGCGITK